MESTPGITAHMDNDLFAGAPHDADYTGGMALHWTPSNQDPHALPHRLHWTLDRALGLGSGSCRQHVWQLGLFSLTPGTLRSDVPLFNDRPFASALVWGTTAIWNGNSERVALQSTLQFAMLGLDLAEDVHAALHRLVNDERPSGYQYQVSVGGEPTARYVFARHELLKDEPTSRGTLQIKNTAAMSLGYLTEGSVSVSMRWGLINSPWQSFIPEMADYLPTPAPHAGYPRAREFYFFGGARLKLRAYNVLNQGQFRESIHVLSHSQLENLLGEAWVGVSWHPVPDWKFTYTYRAQTPELRSNPERRAMVWGGFSFSHRF